MFSQLQLESCFTDNKDFSTGEVVLQPCFTPTSPSCSYSTSSFGETSDSACEYYLSGKVQHIKSMIL